MKSKDIEKLTAIRLEIVRLMNEYNKVASRAELGAKISLLETSLDEDEAFEEDEDSWHSSQDCEWYSSFGCEW